MVADPGTHLENRSVGEFEPQTCQVFLTSLVVTEVLSAVGISRIESGARVDEVMRSSRCSIPGGLQHGGVRCSHLAFDPGEAAAAGQVSSGPIEISTALCHQDLLHMRAFIPHVGWLAHEPGDTVISLLRQGYFESSEQAFVWLYLRPGDVFIDCGAHIGLYSVIASRATGGGARILSVEASVDTASFLKTNLQQNGAKDAHVIRKAVWREPGVIRFLADRPGRSAFARVSFEPSEAAVEVPTTTLDEIVLMSGADEVALVKLDVEGAEPEAIEGAAGSLAHASCPLLMVEFTEANLERRGWSTQRLGALLAGHGLKLCQILPETLELVPVSTAQPIWFANLFATRDPDHVNARLRGADPANIEIARDILARGEACRRFKELEELDSLRGEAVSNRQWALNGEALLKSERQLAASNKQWALNIEAMLAREKELSAELKLWAERAESALAAERERSRQLLVRVEQAESRLRILEKGDGP